MFNNNNNNNMKATFFYFEKVNGKFEKTIESAMIQEEFRGGILVTSERFPNGKCVASENIILIQPTINHGRN